MFANGASRPNHATAAATRALAPSTRMAGGIYGGQYAAYGPLGACMVGVPSPCNGRSRDQIAQMQIPAGGPTGISRKVDRRRVLHPVAHQGPALTIKVHDPNRCKSILWANISGAVEAQPLVSSETPSWCAFAAVAPTVRFNALEILPTPAFFFANDFNSRTSVAVHARRMIFFLAIVVPSRRAMIASPRPVLQCHVDHSSLKTLQRIRQDHLHTRPSPHKTNYKGSRLRIVTNPASLSPPALPIGHNHRCKSMLRNERRYDRPF